MTTQGSARSILLVGGDEDDEVLMRGLLDAILGKQYMFYRYQEIAPPIRLICSELYDLVLLEYMIGPYNGIDLIKQARGQCPQIKLVMVTDWSLPNLEAIAMASGADGFLSKNRMNKETLAQLLAAVLG